MGWSYTWKENEQLIAYGENPTVTLDVGIHNITLTVTDNDGDSNSDAVVINVTTSNQIPIADAGGNQNVSDVDGNGSEQVVLDGSGSNDSDGMIQSYIWSKDGQQIASGANPTVTLDVGTYNITLTVTDNDGASNSDTVVINVITSNQNPIADAGGDH